jgi:hypothetical protein
MRLGCGHGRRSDAAAGIARAIGMMEQLNRHRLIARGSSHFLSTRGYNNKVRSLRARELPQANLLSTTLGTNTVIPSNS